MFRDSDGRVLLQFFKEVCVDSTIYAEVMTLREGLLVAAVSRWSSSYSFMFELNCKSVIVWVANPILAMWNFQNVLLIWCHIFGSRITWSLSHIRGQVTAPQMF